MQRQYATVHLGLSDLFLCLDRFQEHDIEICALGFSKDEKLLATVGNEK